MQKSTLSLNEIYLTKKSKFYLPYSGTVVENNKNLVATLNKNLESLGFTFSKNAADFLTTITTDRLVQFYNELVPILKKMVGAHRQFKPMYPNFPAQVMNATESELYWNAFLHYWSAFISDVYDSSIPIVLPHYEKEDRPNLSEKVKLKVIDVGTIDEFQNIFTNILSSNSSISESDKDIIRWFVQEDSSRIQLSTPESIPQKENLALFVACLLDSGIADFMVPRIKTATDVLRIAAAYSDGDVSLAADIKFRKFSRKDRRFFLKSLENCGEITEDMLRHKQTWKLFAHKLHAGEKPHLYPKVNAALDVLRNNKPFATFNSKVEKGIISRELQGTLDTLSKRPGEFARRLDHLLRTWNENDDIIQLFLKVADKVSTPVLLQTYNHFKNRSKIQGSRSFFPKGSVAKVQVDTTPLTALSDKKTDYLAAMIRETLIKRFSNLSTLGNCYLDESLKKQIVPFAMRSASKALKTIARGSRIPFPETNTIRFFLWWKDGTSRTDIDLSMSGFDKDWNKLLDVSYYDLRDPETGCVHSGDITSAPNGACEFIDIDLEGVKKKNIRFISMSIYSYSGQNFCDLPECFGGWMIRNKPKSGEVFEPKTVQDKIDLSAASKTAIPVIFDIEKREMIWADIALTSRGVINNNHSNSDRVNLMCKALVGINRPNLYDLFAMHVEARGTFTERNGADTVFSMHEGITPYHINEIMSEFLK